MNSKSALEQLYEFALSSEPMELTIKDFKDIILKDLEVLEILKKYLKVSALENWGAYYLDTKDSPIRIDIEEYAKIKEWLENEK